jgi:hypothetical protein
MNKRLVLLLALAVTGVAFAATDEATERRVDSETYEMLAPGLPADAGIATAQPADAATAAPVQDGPLAELRARHQAEFQSLAEAAVAARDNQTREALEAELAGLKARHAREELEWLKADALAKGDAAYAGRLDEALRNLTPAAAPVATTFVPRDPATGRALDGRLEGGAQ